MSIYKHLITKLLSFIWQLGNGLRTLNTLSQEPDHPDYKVSIYIFFGKIMAMEGSVRQYNFLQFNSRAFNKGKNPVFKLLGKNGKYFQEQRKVEIYISIDPISTLHVLLSLLFVKSKINSWFIGIKYFYSVSFQQPNKALKQSSQFV